MLLNPSNRSIFFLFFRVVQQRTGEWTRQPDDDAPTLDTDMWTLKIWFWLVGGLLVSSTLSASQDYDEKRDKDYEDKPYKFGYSIENYLHREEEKDSAGLIHGEFGFVTGDGVYHVTAYATDENGDFKILKMKSYYVGLPGVDGPAVKKDESGKPLPPMNMNPTESTPPQGIMGCGSCIIPTAEPPSTFVQQTPNYQDPSQNYQNPKQNYQNPNQNYQNPNQNYQEPNQNYQDPSQNYQDPNQNYQDPSQNYQNPNQNYQDPNQNYQGPNQYYKDQSQYYQDPSQYSQGPNQYPQDPNQSVYPTFEPVLQDNSFPKAGAEVTNSISSDDMLRLLYRFNYTIGFHGHHEEGDLAGTKKGGYFVNGRDGYGRKFNYIANEFGYQPRVTLEDLRGEEVPREETEKQPKYGLKGYEFRWFF